ncbi:hypothetical protein CW304_11775 [Bacillus sp. UFRGS-B20]|nr:hypothetical protein CW304_11775 [Bacillus sp. UFRGS-B20]
MDTETMAWGLAPYPQLALPKKERKTFWYGIQLLTSFFRLDRHAMILMFLFTVADMLLYFVILYLVLSI